MPKYVKHLVEELPGKLETVLAEWGSNFSVGQWQLVCLARAVLRKNRILVINVDPAERRGRVSLQKTRPMALVLRRTDELIQRTIREKFSDCTVLTAISDRILVRPPNDAMEPFHSSHTRAGRIQAYDEPYALLQDPNGIFYKMVQVSGRREAPPPRAGLTVNSLQAYDSRSHPVIPSGREPCEPRAARRLKCLGSTAPRPAAGQESRYARRPFPTRRELGRKLLKEITIYFVCLFYCV